MYTMQKIIIKALVNQIQKYILYIKTKLGLIQEFKIDSISKRQC